jgi:hypothetical protein
MAQPFEGACLCGSVHFSIQPPSLFCAHCHCGYCRAAHGAAFVTWVGVAEEQFQLDDPKDRLIWHQSSQQSRRGFCRHCGSTLFFASDLAPGEIHVARALIKGEIDRAPAANAFHDQKVPWVNVSGDLASFSGSGPELAHYQAIKGLDHSSD